MHAKLWAPVLAALEAGHDPETYAVEATYVRVHAWGTRARGGYARRPSVGRAAGSAARFTGSPTRSAVRPPPRHMLRADRRLLSPFVSLACSLLWLT